MSTPHEVHKEIGVGFTDIWNAFYKIQYKVVKYKLSRTQNTASFNLNSL